MEGSEIGLTNHEVISRSGTGPDTGALVAHHACFVWFQGVAAKIDTFLLSPQMLAIWFATCKCLYNTKVYKLKVLKKRSTNANNLAI